MLIVAPTGSTKEVTSLETPSLFSVVSKLSGNVDKAISTLKKAADMADSKAEDVNNSISPTFLLQAGKLLESQNKKDEALKLYQDIKKKYVNSSLVQSSEIDKYIERVSE
jgi:tetratricopeptide (TPR) repeat protein